MLLAVLTIFFIVSGTIIYACIKGAVPLDENFNPIKEDTGIQIQAAKKIRSRSMIFLDFSKSRNIA